MAAGLATGGLVGSGRVLAVGRLRGVGNGVAAKDVVAGAGNAGDFGAGSALEAEFVAALRPKMIATTTPIRTNGRSASLSGSSGDG